MEASQMIKELESLKDGIPLDPLPNPRPRDAKLPHAPPLAHDLTAPEHKLAIENALRYFPSTFHEILAGEFAEELTQYGHIYMYRFRPTFPLKAYPIQYYPTRLTSAAAIIHMIFNNLDPAVAQFPEELVTYGGNGQAFSNWAQFWLVMKYLCEMDDDQTLVMYSGHPLGLFPSRASTPRMVITNGMVVPNYSSKDDYSRMFALGVTMYGQMTAGCYCYIGSQGIVHGTVLTVLNAARKYLGSNSLAGKVFVSSGLGGMSGAQAKAAVISGCIGVIAEVSYEALKKRFEQNWLKEIHFDLDKVVNRIREAKRLKEVTSIGFYGNVVSLWERLVQEYEETGERLVDLGSDQTSCHIPYNGGYYPVQVSFEEGNVMLKKDPKLFAEYVQQSLRRQVNAINKLAAKGMKFWDYGNAFLLEAKRAGADVGCDNDTTGLKFRYPSYVQDIMGDIFSLGFGPFRWVCTSGLEEDLNTSDKISLQVLHKIIQGQVSEKVKQQYLDNIQWIQDAGHHQLVVGSQARILYSDRIGRYQIAMAFNEAIKNQSIKGPIVISRDHHDVSGTDSPFRETSNITDGSAFTADMAVQNFTGTALRGATWVALHNGGGVGWGEVINGGFGLVLDGTEATGEKLKLLLEWDVNNGLARRSWSGNPDAKEIIKTAMQQNKKLVVTLPNEIYDQHLSDKIVK